MFHKFFVMKRLWDLAFQAQMGERPVEARKVLGSTPREGTLSEWWNGKHLP